jgi:hypothetical protein
MLRRKAFQTPRRNHGQGLGALWTILAPCEEDFRLWIVGPLRQLTTARYAGD